MSHVSVKQELIPFPVSEVTSWLQFGNNGLKTLKILTCCFVLGRGRVMGEDGRGRGWTETILMELIVIVEQ